MPVDSSHALQKDIDLAYAYLRGAALTPEEVLGQAKGLKKKDKIGLARRILARVRRKGGFDASLGRRLAQEHALCTYKDPDRPVLQALAEALDILRGSFDLEKTKNTDDQEALGLAGAIYKRRWEATGQKDHLERAYQYYRRGYEVGPEFDDGYTGINAAYVLDQLADIERVDGTPAVNNRRAEAKAIREVLIAPHSEVQKASPAIEGNWWWFLVTVAEAHFGLGRYPDAKVWLAKAKALQTSDWEFRSTASQLATLYQLQHPGTISPDDPSAKEANEVLDAFLNSAAARESAFIGKVGLALSGGGFRASLFHIGVLAKLAELDILRRVEVLSCVSGGSIVGAHYYLQLREKMETTDLESLSEHELRDVYIDIVRQLAEDFLAGVQTNIRMRVFANPFRLFRSVYDLAYTRTIRLGELFESELFARIWARDPARPKPSGPLLLKDVKIHPRDAAEDFDPKIYNWRRNAKAPILILNATTLNTGHAWQYTASFMGESPWAIDPNIDGTRRLRRFYHDQAPPGYRSVPLSNAVVASACVPGLFEPLRLDGLYKLEEKGKNAESLTLRQVDGGVHDNQGVSGLLEQGCTVVLVSDASGQTGLSLDPGGGAFAPLTRSNSVLMERVRQEQYARLGAMENGDLLKGLMFLHLKRDLDVTPVDWNGCEDASEEACQSSDAFTEYGIRKQIQALLAGIRTDLDSFSDIEAFALMTSGYRMAATYLPRVEVLPKSQSPSVDWRFLAIEMTMSEASTPDPQYQRIVERLRSGGSRMFRVWTQSRAWLLTTALFGLVLIVLIGLWLIDGNAFSRGFEVTGLWALIALAAAIAMVVPTIREHVGRISIGLLGFLLWIPAWLDLLIIDRVFLKMGRVDSEPRK
jgi:predicted acylesterase/phospholipase RssA